ncbi:NHL domain-containing protein, partial [Roseivirga ehrenbergii]
MNTSRKAPISLRFPLRGIQLLIALLLSFFIFSKAEAQITLANSLSDSDNDGSLIIKRTSNSDASTTPFFYSGMDDSAPKVDENIYISSFTPYTVPVPVTVIDFTGEGWSNSQNLGASLTRSDFVFSHYNSSLVPTAIYASIFGEGFPFTNPDWSLRIDKAYLVIKKTDGSEFDFQSLYAIGVDDQTVSISGYRNTKSVATTSAATSISGARISPSTLDGGFANVDSVVVSNPNGILDTFNFAPPTDLAPPDVKKILVASSPSGSATSINYTVSFYESANNLSIDDFQLTKTGTAQGTISAISAVSGTSVNVTVNAISGDGTLRLDLKSNTNITDDLGNGNNNNGYVQAYTGGVSHTVDFTAPTGYTVSFDQTSVNAVNKSNISFTFSGAEVGGTYSYDFSSSSGGSASTTGRSVLSSSKTVGLSEMEILGDGTVTLNFTHKDAAGNTGNTVTKTIIKDTVLPVFENSTPSSSNIGEKIFDLNLDMNEAGKLYYVIVPDGATAPTAADVKAGNANGGGTPVTGGNASVTTGGFSNTFNVAGLSIVTAYDVYAIAEDVAGNLVNTVSKIDVATVDLNDPVFTSPTTANFAENGTGTAYTAVATDANTITYSLGNAKDEALFNIVGATGVVTFKNAPDFENPTDGNTDNAYVINVIANDGTHSVNQDVTITVTDIDEINPVFTSATTANFAENGTGTAYTVVATDVNTVTYSLGNAKDEALFNIVGTTGVVTFKNAPDYENPADGNTDNAYVINVIASDGRNSVNQNVTITVTDIDEINPVFTSATTANFAENGIGAAYTVVATDANALTYSLSGCFDDALFNIANGVVTFKNTPDFETPVDVDANNTYVINVVASDGVNSVNQDVTITVTNVNEDPSITSNAVTAGNDNATYTYNITTSDIDNDAVTVTATVKPDWLSLSSSATVSTFAGSGTSGYADGTGTAASFGQPFGMVVDNTGNLYVSSYSHRIRKITPAGVVSIFAGSGDYGSANGTGTAASFANPSGMAMDAAGNLFVADFGNHTIRKITPAGVVTTFAGMNGVRGSADATGTNASFSGPIGMAIDGSDNLYVTELVNNRIRKITPTGVVTTFAGSGSGTPVDGTGLVAAFGGPDAIEIDESGNLYVTEQNSHLVRKITPAGVVTTIAGTGSTGSADGTGTSASFNTPYDVLVDGSNNLLIADAFNHTIRKITPAGEVTTIAGLALNTGSENGAGTDARFNSPIGLAMNSDGEVFVAELGNHLIRKIVFGDQLSGDATGQSGNHNVTLTASDGNGATATQSFVVDVSRVLTPDDDNILYVNKDVRGGNGRGGSWANAVTELADALVWAKENYDNTWATTPLQIWVAGGTYKPLYTPEDGEDFAVGTDPRDNAFLLVNNVELYGGFAGTETALTDRDLSLTANATILSGDFNDDDVVTGTGSSISFSGNTENAYHVIISAGSVGKARVDGFTVTNANANGSNSITVNSISFIRNYGGGMFIDASSPTIQQSTFVHNYSSDYGSGIFNDHSSAPKVSNSIFKDNKVGSCGAAMYNYNSSSPTITNSLFIGNSADDYGGAIYNSASSSSIIINSTIIANSAASDGEGIYIHTSTATIQNSIVWNEISIYNGGTYTIENSVVQGSSDVSDGNIDATSLTVNDLFTDQANGDYSLKHTSPAVNTGNNALYTGTLGTDKDLAGSPRLYDGAPATDIIDMGAYEYRDIIDPVFTSATTANFAENGTSTAYTVAATDANTVSYSLGTGNDEALFNIVGATGVVTFKNSPDFENPADGDANNTYAINVIASDGINSVNQDVTITVTNVDDTDPVFTSLTTANFAE